jgi:hypothetical protein
LISNGANQKRTSLVDFVIIDVQSTSTAVTQDCWDVLQKKFDFFFYNKGIFVWSDIAFRSKSLIEYFSLLAIKLQLRIQLHFFAPHRSDSICDRHFGTAKQSLRTHNLNKPITNLNAIVRTFASISNTTIYEVNILKNLQAEPFDPKGFPDGVIRSMNGCFNNMAQFNIEIAQDKDSLFVEKSNE